MLDFRPHRASTRGYDSGRDVWRLLMMASGSVLLLFVILKLPKPAPPRPPLKPDQVMAQPHEPIAPAASALPHAAASRASDTVVVALGMLAAASCSLAVIVFALYRIKRGFPVAKLTVPSGTLPAVDLEQLKLEPVLPSVRESLAKLAAEHQSAVFDAHTENSLEASGALSAR
jgi:hypothetical protein